MEYPNLPESQTLIDNDIFVIDKVCIPMCPSQVPLSTFNLLQRIWFWTPMDSYHVRFFVLLALYLEISRS
jgi:hypothetical protein